MDIIKTRQDRRRTKILAIRDSIKNTLDQKKEVSFKDIVLATCANVNLSKRTAEEYVDIALAHLKLNREDLIEKETTKKFDLKRLTTRKWMK